MTPAETAAMFALLTDAVKILGPAGLAAFVSYRVAKTQAGTELAKVRAEHAYRARSEMFALHKGELEQGAATSKQIAEATGQIVGYIAGLRPAEGEGPLPILSIVALNYSRRVPDEFAIVAARFQDAGIGDRPELRMLSEAVRRVPDWGAAIRPSIPELTERLLALQTAYDLLQRCLSLLIERELKGALAAYLESTK